MIKHSDGFGHTQIRAGADKPGFLLTHPPFSEPYAPYLSLPELSAVLKQNDFPCRCLDLNLVAHEELLTGKHFKDALQTIFSDPLSAVNNIIPLRKKNPAFKKKDALLKLRAYGNFLSEHIDEAKYNLRQRASCMFDSRGRAQGDRPFYIFDRARRIFFLSPLLHACLSHDDQGYFLSKDDIRCAVSNHRESLYHEFFKRQLNEQRDYSPAVIGISITFAEQVIPGVLLAVEARNMFPNSVILLGGNYPTLMMERLVECTNLFDVIDGIAHGAGETTLLQVGRNLSEGTEWHSGIDNVAFRNNLNNIMPPQFSGTWDIRNSPPPDFDDFVSQQYFVAEPQLVYMTGRGCYWGKCSFCNYSAIHRKYSKKDIFQVVGDLETLSKKYGTRAFYLADDAVSPRRLVDISRGINKKRLNLAWWCLSRFDRGKNDILWTHEEMKEIVRAGCYRIFFGGESADECVQESCNKGFKVEAIRRSIEDIRKSDLHAHVSMIIGLPGETVGSARATLKWALDIATIPRLSARVHRFRLAYNSPLSHNQELLECQDNEFTNLAPNIRYFRELGRDKTEQEEFSAEISTLKHFFLKKYKKLPLHCYPENHNYEGLQYQINYNGLIPRRLETGSFEYNDSGILLQLNPNVAFGLISSDDVREWRKKSADEGKQDVTDELGYVLLYNFSEESFIILPSALENWIAQIDMGSKINSAALGGFDKESIEELSDYLLQNGWLIRTGE